MRSQSIQSRACDLSASVMPSDDSWPKASLPAARRRSPVCYKTHTSGLFSLVQTSRMAQHTFYTSLLVFFIARQNVPTMTPLQLFPSTLKTPSILCPDLILRKDYCKINNQLLTPAFFLLRLDQTQIQSILVMTFYGNTFRATMAAKVCSSFIVAGPLDTS